MLAGHTSCDHLDLSHTYTNGEGGTFTLNELQRLAMERPELEQAGKVGRFLLANITRCCCLAGNFGAGRKL